MSNGWIGVDLDGTLAHATPGAGPSHIGLPIGPMVNLVKRWRAQGRDVRILTARVAVVHSDCVAQLLMVQSWCRTYLGEVLPIQAYKDGHMWVLFDDRAVNVVRNTGRLSQQGCPEELL